MKPAFNRKMVPRIIASMFLLIALLMCGAIPHGSTRVSAEVSLSPEGFTQVMPGTDTLTVYVSSSSGDDSNDGLSESKPVRTIAKALSLVRDGYPDHILLKRGDVWTDESLGRFKSGRSADEPMVISYYGDSGPRPLIKASKNFVDHDGSAGNYQWFIGLHIKGYKLDPDTPEYDRIARNVGMRFVGSGDSILVEDCVLQFCSITVQSYDPEKAKNIDSPKVYRNFKLRRSMIIDNYARDSSVYEGKVQGIFAEAVDGLLIEENLFDHNGWSEKVARSGANMFNHNMYINTGNVGNKVIVRGNIIARASSHGVHGRPGGLYEDNLFVENSISLQMGYFEVPLKAGTFAHARNNVILQGKLMDPADSNWPRSAAVWGLELDNLGEGTVTVEGNIVANRRDSGNNIGIRQYDGVTYINNIQYNWGGGIGDMPNPGWLDPERSVGSYHGTLGKTPTLEAFLMEARSRGPGEWPEEYTAYAVNAYIREGFTVAGTPDDGPASAPAGMSTPEPTAVPAAVQEEADRQEPGGMPFVPYAISAVFIGAVILMIVLKVKRK